MIDESKLEGFKVGLALTPAEVRDWVETTEKLWKVARAAIDHRRAEKDRDLIGIEVTMLCLSERLDALYPTIGGIPMKIDPTLPPGTLRLERTPTENPPQPHNRPYHKGCCHE